MRGQIIAKSHRPELLFETGLPTHYYLPFAEVRTELLTLSTTVSQCPDKGDGQHWHVIDPVEPAGHTVDAAWSLPHPLAEAEAALEHGSFYPDGLEVWVDGTRVAA